MISSVELCINHSVKVAKLGIDRPVIRFEPGYNVLIGPNGAGKSTVLRAVARCPFCTLEGSGREGLKYISTESLNPNMGGVFDGWEQMVQGIRALFLSHGQGVADGLLNQAHGGETAVLIDSPETGQDQESAGMIYRGLRKMAERYQVIIASNSLVFMQGGHLVDLGRDTLPRLVASTRELTENFGAMQPQREEP
ncbi:MAG: ATP-binding protein [Acidobacteria bacterium]|nr:ATP-binding protein [Acidobacteriota bacterium]